eukprot:TRINITY_DN32021_c0_g1_i1.p1 TRINITY_DN32021_c0_g1~~TRINITY_DN32021_c0_g1_i1.p1  ORF type:complete len:125 (+),score=21.02 TRINITY_DN32021_c0_g1_i1:61-435(+)
MSGVTIRMRKRSLPIKILLESRNQVIALETNSGEVYRGCALDIQESLNVRLGNVTLTYRNGRTAHLEQVYLRGSVIKFFVLPDALRLRYEEQLSATTQEHKARMRERQTQRQDQKAQRRFERRE